MTLATQDTRLNLLKDWLKDTYQGEITGIEVASADASFRRYFRVLVSSNEQSQQQPEQKEPQNIMTLIAMDAPPDKENCEPFIKIARLLEAQGVHTPKIYEQSTELGFVLLEDLGSTDYSSKLTDLSSANSLYTDAIDALLKVQCGKIEAAAPYSAEKLREEMSLFPEWFIKKHLNQSLSAAQLSVWETTQQFLCDVCQEQPQVWVHRDYHSRNLMVTPTNNPGVIDFQDLLSGPIAYDLASIFKDCYIEWPRQQQLRWLREYFNKLQPSDFTIDELVRWFDLVGLQRHLKVLGIFCRLNYRDGKSRYLSDLPLVAKYCIEVFALYPELKEFQREFEPLIEQAL